MEKIQNFFTQLLGMPVLASESGAATDRLIVYVHLLMFALFIGWLAYFIFALWRFNAARSIGNDNGAPPAATPFATT